MTDREDERHGRAVERQFAPAARAYLASASHASGDDLQALVELAAPRAEDELLDVGCGVGHTLRRLAPAVRLAVGLDPTVGMLEGARGLLEGSGITNAILVVSPAERLPFLDASFDVVTCRLAAHHVADVAAAFREVRRVLRPNGRFLLADNYAPDDAELDRFVNTLERFRDPSHVREHTATGWRDVLAAAGLVVDAERRTALRIDRERWLAQSRTGEADADRVRALLAGASPAARETFRIDETGFSLLKIVLRATAS